MVAADPVVLASLLLAPSRSLSATADRFANFTIQLVDAFGNFRTKGGEQVRGPYLLASDILGPTSS